MTRLHDWLMRLGYAEKRSHVWEAREGKAAYWARVVLIQLAGFARVIEQEDLPGLAVKVIKRAVRG